MASTEVHGTHLHITSIICLHITGFHRDGLGGPYPSYLFSSSGSLEQKDPDEVVSVLPTPSTTAHPSP